MDPAFYKIITTSRGFQYHYYHSPTQDPTLPTLFFLHGFPAMSNIWWHQVEFFSNHGFRLIIPDLLGFGRSSKPTDPGAYTPSLICRDMIDILDAECVNQAVAIGHDIGSDIVSRLANTHSTRFLGYGFLAIPYSIPRPTYDLQRTLKGSRKGCGYELDGHTLLYTEPGTSALIESHLESFYSAMFPTDPKMWVTQVAPIGALKSWLEANRTTSMPPYLTLTDKQVWQDAFRNGGFEAPLCWYKALASGITSADDECEYFLYFESPVGGLAIPLEKYNIEQPVFFGAARHDYISRSVFGIAGTNRSCKDACIREFNAGRWLMISNHAEVNNALLSWVMDIIV